MHLYFSELGALHFYSACASLLLGALILLMPKGTKLHRAIGLTYVFAMLEVNATALMLYHLTGHFGVFHVFALVSLLGVLAGVAAVIFRWRGWLNSHYRSMSFSYIGLVAAAAAETLVRVPALHVRGPVGAFAIGIAMAAVFGIGGSFLVRRLRPSVLALEKAGR